MKNHSKINFKKISNKDLPILRNHKRILIIRKYSSRSKYLYFLNQSIFVYRLQRDRYLGPIIDNCQMKWSKDQIKNIKQTFYLKIPFSNCTFPYSYLVTTSSQLVIPWRKLLIYKFWKHYKPLFPLEDNHLSDRDGRFVQSSSTNSPQLCWFAITGDSHFMFSSCRKQFVLETFKDLLQNFSLLFEIPIVAHV